MNPKLHRRSSVLYNYIINVSWIQKLHRRSSVLYNYIVKVSRNPKLPPLNTPSECNVSHDTSPPYGQYPTHAHSHIILAVAPMDSCFVLVRTHGVFNKAIRFHFWITCLRIRVACTGTHFLVNVLLGFSWDARMITTCVLENSYKQRAGEAKQMKTGWIDENSSWY